MLNPKIGVMWEPFGPTTIRAAWLRTVKRSFASGQTVEPTQVAGFNQLFDDADGTRFQRYGFGVDQRLPWHLNAGFEFTWRDLEIQRFIAGDRPATERIAQEETAHRAYVFWTPTYRTTVSAQYFYEEFEREPLRLLANGRPLSAVLHRAPFSLGYYHPQGFFARLTATYVNQNAAVRDDSVASGESQTSDRFWLTDLSLGYRLPKRFGLVTFGIKNLFDEGIQFQELSPNVIGDIEGELVPPLFVPERVLFGQLTLAF